MDRYSRQLLYKNIGKMGQLRLLKSSVCVVGIGALGGVCSELLTRAGIGKLTLIDQDKVVLNNLQRQVLFDEKDIGKSKVACAKQKLSKINSEIEINIIREHISSKNIFRLIKKHNIILGCTDNLVSRFLLNDFCLKNKIPFITGMVAGDTGYVFNVISGNPCFSCVFDKESCFNCNNSGILNTNSAIIGSLMVNETLKILMKKEYEKKLIRFDIWKNAFDKIKVKKRKNCPACNKIYSYL